MVGVYVLLENNAPESSKAVINQNGIGVGEVFYDYGQISGFEIVFEEKEPKFMRIALKKNHLRTIDIPVYMLKETGVEIGDLRTLMLQYIPE
jgi:hypothetical protein